MSGRANELAAEVPHSRKRLEVGTATNHQRTASLSIVVPSDPVVAVNVAPVAREVAWFTPGWRLPFPSNDATCAAGCGTSAPHHLI